jgi:hypothetical protein
VDEDTVRKQVRRYEARRKQRENEKVRAMERQFVQFEEIFGNMDDDVNMPL